MKRRPNPKLFMGLALLTLVGGSAACYYQYASYSDQGKAVESLRVDTRPESQIVADLEKAEAQLSECTAKLTHLEQGVPPFAFLPTMLSELELLGTSTGIDVLGVRPVPAPARGKDEKVPKKSAYQEMNIEVKGRGTYESVMQFVEALKAFPKIVEARTVSLTPKNIPGETGSPQLDVDISLRAYLFPPSKGERPSTAPPADAAPYSGQETQP